MIRPEIYDARILVVRQSAMWRAERVTLPARGDRRLRTVWLVL